MCEQKTKSGHRFLSKYLRKLGIFMSDFTSKNPGTKFNSSLNILFLSFVVIKCLIRDDRGAKKNPHENWKSLGCLYLARREIGEAQLEIQSNEQINGVR